MADIAERIVKARTHAAPDWTPEREHAVRDAIDRRLAAEGRRRGTFALALAALVATVAGFFVYARFETHGPTAAVPAAPAAPAALVQFEDGTTVTARSPEARVEPVEVSANAVAVRLASGGARFSVTPNQRRTFRILARNVTVTVLGTVFTVDLEAGGVRVAVERGRVHVAWPEGERDLAVGEQTLAGSAEVPGAKSGPSPEERAEEPAAPPPAAPERALHTTPAPASWRALAQDGDYAAAFARMTAEGPAAVRDEPGDLLLAADVSRLGGHPERAIAWLERVVGAHAGDSRAPLAAFTLGRTQLDQLGRPREAAAAFASARRLAPSGALAQDALAREVECWSRAGEAQLAHARAEQYVAAYPKGRRLAAVKRLGGVD